ncbi:prepilin-type N-terminal cleavage/methylation domain-containing protein [Cyanobium gracile UHCC 0139]|uniref:Prepilin-type N-terminal cleavage/methylation domain-containing protein n=1 Tax=Cyanobium gracile UHCC 0139 TaxID=3110308 RepID=A0ABU5RSP3_9CYAN|nr:prepilin-type N-terminal cleavage/methylation domain-containing protein [Cyanobium gracile]MEA5390778.1 prepilin-type N-terminal cleavage/methylation domain-containing protein [Cyanobium gracile UHCC 0139]
MSQHPFRWLSLPRVSAPLHRPHLGRLSIAGTSGFTLLELMIVAAIVGILSAIVVPQYRRAMAVAEASSSILETVAFAEQCAVAHKSGLHTVVDPPGGPSRNCNGTSARQINSRSWSGDASGVLCMGQQAQGTHRRAMLRVAVNGSITCTFLP